MACLFSRPRKEPRHLLREREEPLEKKKREEK